MTIKAKVIESNHESVKVGDVWILNQCGEKYESNGFVFVRNSSGLYEMLLFRGGVLLERCN